MKWYQSIDAAGSQWASRQTKTLSPLYRLAHVLGSPVVTLLILGAIAAWSYYTLDSAFFKASIFYLIAFGVGIGLKYVIARPRPSDYYKTHRHATYSFPSGHSLGSVLSLGLAIQLIWYYVDAPFIAWSVLVLSILAMLTVGVSRVYHNHHYLTDVLGGWLLGALTVVLAQFLIFS